MSWYESAIKTMSEVYLANRHLPEKEILNLIDAAYPFGQRSLHPYKMWLKARRNFIKDNLKTLYKPKPQITDINQMEAIL